jgi:hypothetical protein
MPESVIINTEEIDRLIKQIKPLESINFAPLMEEWRDILQTDNENNLGIDGYGVPMEAVTYRPDEKAGTRKSIKYDILANNNLTSGHYRTLDGPPLSPRGHDSRVTTTFRTWWDRPDDNPDNWSTYAGWEDFISLDELEILPFHAAGDLHNPKLPIRDLLHIRPSALAKARDALISFVNKLLGKPG